VYCNIITWISTKVRGIGPKEAHAAALAVTATPVAAVARERVQDPQTIDTPIQKAQLDLARLRRDRNSVEIQKKFSLAAACIVLALVGGPIALRFPRGGVGLVIGVSFSIFSLYYVGLIAGESLSNKGYVTPFWGMWAMNILFLVIGLILYARMGHEAGSSRGGDLREWLWMMRQRINGRSPLDAALQSGQASSGD
jgi:lipopolysaccharide export system permease protein